MWISEIWLSALIAIGRVGLASLFLLGGFNKVLNYAEVLNEMSEVGLPQPGLLLPLVILLELCGGLAVAIGRYLVAPFALALAVFTIATNFVFHDFWNLNGDMVRLELALFFKNISIAGAMILVAGWSLKAKTA